jgi:hypothetical protein
MVARSRQGRPLCPTLPKPKKRAEDRLRSRPLSRTRLPAAPPFEASAAACDSREEGGRKIRAKALKSLLSRKESGPQTAASGGFWQAFSARKADFTLKKKSAFLLTNVSAFPRRSWRLPRGRRICVNQKT